jgi:glutamate mutase epsilon subunit
MSLRFFDFGTDSTEWHLLSFYLEKYSNTDLNKSTACKFWQPGIALRKAQTCGEINAENGIFVYSIENSFFNKSVHSMFGLHTNSRFLLCLSQSNTWLSKFTCRGLIEISEWIGKLIIRFVDIGGIVDHYWLHLL